jgi:alkanesulfonate monooxygenase SsuD/methylene tetrahydromethanopterin reductase-like flavin-dependent oxidoreductase (luciferase family)
MVKPDIERYRTAWRAHHGETAADPALNPRVGMTLGLFCLEDGARAREIARTNITWFYRELLKTTAPVLERLHAGYEYYRKLGSLKFLLDKAVHLKVLETAGMVVAGDPEHCRRRLETFRDAGVDHLLCAIGAGGSPPDVVIESMRTLARHVMPHFAA